METYKQPFLKSLSQKGYVQGVTLSSKPDKKPLCHYFGGLRYALPPTERWRKAQKLPRSYSYGTKENPSVCPGATGVCPQPAFLNLSTTDGWAEDCFQVNMWVPTGEPPKGGWPVLFFIHGGFLQFGHPNLFSATALIGETDFNAIVVMPAYRVGVFGFLYSSELEQDNSALGESVGNHGFWDQRMALEWTAENIGLFGGNSSEITISGYSAGAYSVCYQLFYDLQVPAAQSLVKRACIWSNSPTTQPKSPQAAQVQFHQLLSKLNIPISLSSAEKLARLRALPASTLLSAATSVDIHQWRPTTDGTFVLPTTFTSIDDGSIARALRARNIRIIAGECRDEHYLYATWFPPQQNTLASLRHRLLADYPKSVVDTLISHYYPDGQLPANCENWSPDAFGRIYADIQVHKIQRGFIDALARGGAGDLIHRYRIEYRLKCADKSIPPSWGVTHATDQYIWFWGNGEVIEDDEKKLIKTALIDPLKKFVHGQKEIGWGTNNHREVRRLGPDGHVEIWQDELWDESLKVWNILREAREKPEDMASRL